MNALEKIMKEIDKLKENCLSLELESGYAAGALDMANAIKDVIHKCESDNDGWIPVEEGLPEETDSIFKKFKDTNKWSNAMWEKKSDEVNITYELEDGTRKSGTSYTIDGKWKCEKENSFVKRKVIAWQLLPESYKPKKHEKEHKNTQLEMEDFWNDR